MKDIQKIVLFPFSGNAREALDACKEWDVLGFIDDDDSCSGKSFSSVSVIGNRSKLSELLRDKSISILAVPGRPETHRNRLSLIHSLNISADRWATVIHPTAVIGPNVEIGSNVLIMANTVITGGNSIGNHVVVLPNTTISHDTSIGDGSLIGSNVSISGSVNIGNEVYIGSGSRIINEISIGDRSLVGLGSVVIRDIKPNVRVVGCPARELLLDSDDSEP